jgi:hypothetical protein
MTMVMSVVRGSVEPARLDEIRLPYESAITAGLPPAIVATYLLTEPNRDVAIATVWRDRAALEAMVASGEEPLARRLIREAGGEPKAEFLDVIAASTNLASNA